ncbi:MAG: hypothetical protein AAF443_02885, partial [Chlamydiota bacterium]
IQNAKRSVIWRGYFDRIFSWVLIRQVDKTQGKIGQKGPPNALRFLHFESASVYHFEIMSCKGICNLSKVELKTHSFRFGRISIRKDGINGSDLVD